MCNDENPEHKLTLNKQQSEVQQRLIISWDP